jgi:hypothetical protein
MYIILAIGLTFFELPLSYVGTAAASLRVAAKTCDRGVTQMETFPWGSGSKRQEDDFPRCLYSNDMCSMEAIIAESRKENSGISSLASRYPITEDIIAIVSSIPSGILIYASVHYGAFLSSVGQITCVVAVAIGSTIALQFDALRLLARPGRNTRKI